MTGYELARQLKSSFGSALYIALTGYGRCDDGRLSKAAGFDYHMIKAVDVDRMQEILGSTKSLSRPVTSQ